MITRPSPAIQGTANEDRHRLRIGSVSFINTKPLVYGLERADDIDLHLAVPSKLLDGLGRRDFDVALLPVIDYQRMEGLRIIPSGGIASDGPTLTVRLFSKSPIAQMRCLACDADSHTSVALARIILSERFGIQPHFDPQCSDAKLLIGDKVVCEEPAGYEHQLDLGQAWKEMTGLPFVFAVWMARSDIDLGALPARLEQSKRDGLAHVDQIVERYAIPRGWPKDLARRYLTSILQYDITERHLQAIGLFHHLAAKHGLIEASPRPLAV